MLAMIRPALLLLGNMVEAPLPLFIVAEDHCRRKVTRGEDGL